MSYQRVIYRRIYVLLKANTAKTQRSTKTIKEDLRQDLVIVD